MKAGIVGLGVMGRNLALNMRDGGYGVAVTDSWEDARDWRAEEIDVVATKAELTNCLPAPRVVLLMVKAGEQVDREIADLVPHLSAGDVVIDGGNSHYRDTNRRAEELSSRGILYLGAGISGGAEGARNGASLMIGGDEAAWATARDLLTVVVAKAGDGAPTITLFGDAGAGHFVKMVHNGIEYAIMQAIAECHGLMRDVGGLPAPDIAETLERWNGTGRASGFLLEITAEIVRTSDPQSDGCLLDHISDVAGQKGTGAWTIEAALEHGVPVPSIMEAVTARQVSGQADLRKVVSGEAGARSPGEIPDTFVDDIEQALVATIIVALAQGLHLYGVAAAEHGWNGNLSDALRVWRAGSILQMPLLDEIAGQIDADPAGHYVLDVPSIARDVTALLPAWQRCAGSAVASGFAAPVLLTSLAYFQALGTVRLPTAMIQAQRDRFGAHGFLRIDQDGVHHGPWQLPDAEI